MTATIQIPRQLLPHDGRFGSGPSKVLPHAANAVASASPAVLGTSHRQPPVRRLVASVQAGLRELFSLPAEWDVVLGNGGASAFWEIATVSLIRERSQHVVVGEFSQKFADIVDAAPFLASPERICAKPGFGARPAASAVDTYALIHNETSTGVAIDPTRPDGDAIVVVDATSAAGAIPWNLDAVDVYYFSPQKCFGADGGMWIALMSPAAVARLDELHEDARWRPPFLDLGRAVESSRLNQTYNTPAIATLLMMEATLTWLNIHGGLEWAARRCRTSSDLVYEWAEDTSWANPFVHDAQYRSPVVTTIDLDYELDALHVARALRENGIVDTEPYRGLGRNQLRIATFPAVEPSDVELLLSCITYVAERTG